MLRSLRRANADPARLDRRDPGLAYLALALVAAVALYAPTLGRGLVNYDDPWLVGDNWIVHHAVVAASLHRCFFDLDSPQRFVLAPSTCRCAISR